MMELVQRALILADPHQPLPLIARMLFPCSTWILALPVPWLGLAVRLTYRRDLSIGTSLVYGAWVSIAAVVTVGSVAVVCFVPYMGLVNR